MVGGVGVSGNLKLVGDDLNRDERQHADSVKDGDWQAQLRRLCVYTPETLAKMAKSQARQGYLVDGLIREKSVNLLVGDSGLGKTPLGVQLGLCIAAGLPFLDRHCERGRVLYCDAESDPQTFTEMIARICGFLGLDKKPDDFLVWSPHWESRAGLNENFFSEGRKLLSRVDCLKPTFVLVDPLRMFWPEAESGNDEAAKVVKSLKSSSSETGAAWLITHHRRKPNQQFGTMKLAEDPHGWFREAAGAHALVNQTDSRIGVVEPHSGVADLLLGGFIRMSGPFVPLDLSRASDDDGEPIGYHLLKGIEYLTEDQRTVYAKLSERFRFKDAHSVIGGTSASNVTNFCKKCVSLGLVEKDGKEYVKTHLAVERVERVEHQTDNTPSTP